MTHLNPTALGLALGIVWGACLLLLALAANFFGYGIEWVDMMGTVYKGLSGTLPGAFAGLVWGFVDGFIGGWLIGWIYNKLS